MGYLTEPFSDPGVQRAWLELALLSVPAGALGVFVVLRRLAFTTHLLSVGAFPGTVLALGLGFSTFAGGLTAAAGLALLLALLERRSDLDTPAATGLLLAGALACGALLATDVFDLAQADADAVLFGPAAGVSDAGLARAALVAAASLTGAALCGRGWLLVAFERENAPAFGFSPARMDLVLLGLLAATAVAALDAVGALLVTSLLVIPAGAARMLVRGMLRLMLVSCGLAFVVSTAGLWLSVRLDVPQGAAISLVGAAAFAALLVWQAARGRRVGGPVPGARRDPLTAGAGR